MLGSALNMDMQPEITTVGNGPKSFLAFVQALKKSISFALLKGDHGPVYEKFQQMYNVAASQNDDPVMYSNVPLFVCACVCVSIRECVL